MRTIILSILLASVAAAPAAAQRDDRSDRDKARAERQQEREEREERSDARDEHRGSEYGRGRAGRSEQQGPGVEAAARAEVRAEARADRRDLDKIRDVRAAAQPPSDSVREWRSQERQALRERRREIRAGSGELRQSERAVPPILRNRAPLVTEAPQAGSQPPLRAERRRTEPAQWSTHWRRNGRYDWYNWRNRHRSLFRLGFYHDPFGWGYRPYSIGWRMWPSYYRSSYWLNDPWQFRLPYSPPGTRWIRYYDDAILVDTWDGRVVDVIHNFFW